MIDDFSQKNSYALWKSFRSYQIVFINLSFLQEKTFLSYSFPRAGITSTNTLSLNFSLPVFLSW